MELICRLFELYIVILIVRALLSWFPISGEGVMATVASAVYTITEPVLAPVRGVIPPVGGFDISFLVVVFGLQILSASIC